MPQQQVWMTKFDKVSWFSTSTFWLHFFLNMCLVLFLFRKGIVVYEIYKINYFCYYNHCSYFFNKEISSLKKTITVGEGSVLMVYITKSFQKFFESLFVLIPSPDEDRAMQII
jgi:hypothetical protein